MIMTHSTEANQAAAEIRAEIDKICKQPDEIDYVAILDFRRMVEGDNVIRFEPTTLVPNVGQHLKRIKNMIADERDKYQHAKYKKARFEPNVDFIIAWVPTDVDDALIGFFGFAPYDEDVFRLAVDDRKTGLIALWRRLKQMTKG
jgi:hypothetical protein